jgi:hypothetical protein
MKDVMAVAKVVKSAAIDPEEWLLKHDPVLSSADTKPDWLEAGSDAILIHGGCVVSALASTPDLRVEIVLAHILDSDEISDSVRERIYALAEAMVNV